MNYSLYSNLLTLSHDRNSDTALPPHGAQAKVAAAHHFIALLPRCEAADGGLVGKIIGIPGSEWGSGSDRVSAAEKATRIFKCVMRDHKCTSPYSSKGG